MHINVVSRRAGTPISPNIIGLMPTQERSADAPISESDLVEIINRHVGGGDAFREDEVGVGDDAAVLRFQPGHVVLTADAMVDGVHFLSGSMSWYDIGWKCIVSNQSDIAAMGALPEHAVLTLAIPASTRVADLENLLEGVVGALDQFGGRLVGGDTVASEVVMLSVALTGRLCESSRMLKRTTARPGQQIVISGPLGGSAGGLAFLKETVESKIRRKLDDDQNKLLDAHFRPAPRVDLAPTLVDAGIECAMDVSDGLLIDLERICVASGVDAVVYADRVPREPCLVNVYPEKARQFALTGGEDYEILYVGDANAVDQVNTMQLGLGDGGVEVIGEIVPRRGETAEVTVLDETGHAVEIGAKGWDHFAR